MAPATASPAALATDPAELGKFEALGERWWDPKGPMAPLHKMNPVRIAFVRDEQVVKVQQAADYPDAAYNPRGCMKGISYHTLIHGADRITKPVSAPSCTFALAVSGFADCARAPEEKVTSRTVASTRDDSFIRPLLG